MKHPLFSGSNSTLHDATVHITKPAFASICRRVMTMSTGMLATMGSPWLLT
jgi:hypothetical protein